MQATRRASASSKLLKCLVFLFPVTLGCPAEDLGITDKFPGDEDVRVASVDVSVPKDTIRVRDLVQLTATPRDSAGNPLGDRRVTWWSDNPSVATVDSAGLVTGKAPGSLTITATSEGVSGSASLTVTAPPGTVAECESPQPGWIWCDDFEQDRLSGYFEYESVGGTFVRTAGAGRDGSYGMLARFLAGQVEGGVLHLAFGKVPDPYFRTVDEGTAKYRDIYWRFYVRYQAHRTRSTCISTRHPAQTSRVTFRLRNSMTLRTCDGWV
jgi:hypothetical protein